MVGRIIVRSAETTLIVSDISNALNGIADLATEFGGWVVSSFQLQKHTGSIAIRVPADRFDETISRLRNMVVDVESLISKSEDFTDEFVDTESRVRNLRATEATLLSFLDKAETVEEALLVQIEVSAVQEEIEILEGRLSFLGQASAFSLISVELKLVPTIMPADAGPDLTVLEGEWVSFKASFIPPDGIDEFNFEWDFGDDSPVAKGNRTAPTPGEAGRTTGTVTHMYASYLNSPYIVSFKISGSGEAGRAEAEDSVIVTVLSLDPISVFAGEDVFVTEGQDLSFEGSFTRPQGLSNFQFEWDFGDGSPSASGAVSEGVTTSNAAHTYQNYRPTAFIATLTVTADSEAGSVEASDSVAVSVSESRSWVSDWGPGNTLRDAVRTFVTLAQGLGTALIWLVILSPLWIGLALALRFARRYWHLIWKSDSPSPAAPPEPPAPPDSEP
ncbi:MAG: DUF4349 domain-containing protein [Chloroflexi bacterium]|nr:DUF4349 domain-containing protein [Chloroflexota bacterium]